MGNLNLQSDYYYALYLDGYATLPQFNKLSIIKCYKNFHQLIVDVDKLFSNLTLNNSSKQLLNHQLVVFPTIKKVFTYTNRYELLNILGDNSNEAFDRKFFRINFIRDIFKENFKMTGDIIFLQLPDGDPTKDHPLLKYIKIKQFLKEDINDIPESLFTQKLVLPFENLNFF